MKDDGHCLMWLFNHKGYLNQTVKRSRLIEYPNRLRNRNIQYYPGKLLSKNIRNNDTTDNKTITDIVSETGEVAPTIKKKYRNPQETGCSYGDNHVALSPSPLPSPSPRTRSLTPSRRASKARRIIRK